MKRNGLMTVLAAALALSVAAVMTGCTDDGGGTYLDDNNYSRLNSDGTMKVTLSVDPGKSKVQFTNGTAASSHIMATIQPAATTSANYKFFLCYKGTSTGPTGGADKVKAITLTPDTTDTTGTKGTYSVDMEKDVYTMTLYAVPSGSSLTASSTEAQIKAEAVLRSYSVVDMRYQNKASFMLSPNGLPGKGKYEITVEKASDCTLPAGSDYDVEAVLCKEEITGSTEITATKHALPIVSTAGTNIFKSPENKMTNPDADGIESGTYNIKVTFKPKAGGKTYVIYPDDVIIMPNQTSIGTIYVGDIVTRGGTAPNPPKDFIAAYKPPTGDRTGYYTVEFGWTDTSGNETGFELDLMRVDDAAVATPTTPAMPTKDSEWDGLKTTYGITKIFDAASYSTASTALDGVIKWRDDPDAVEMLTLNSTNLGSFVASMASQADGSLAANSNHLKILLTMEHRYVARIRAVNQDGASVYTYLTLPATTPATAGVAAGDSFTASDNNQYTSDCTTTAFTGFTANTPFATGVETVNLYRIKYNIGSGVFSGVPSGVPNISLTSFHSQKTGGVNLLTPDSKNADATTSVAITEVRGETNDEEMSGVAGGAGLVELKLDTEYSYWKCWSYESSGSGNDYTQSGGTTGRKNAPYTKCANLELFATYESGGDAALTGDIRLNILNKYELKPEYVTLNLYDGVSDTSTSNYTSGALANNVKLNALGRANTFPIPRGKGTGKVYAIGFKVEATGFKYDNIRMEMWNGGAMVAGKDGETSGSAKEVKVTLPSGVNGDALGKCTVRIYAYKGAYTLALQSALILNLQ